MSKSKNNYYVVWKGRKPGIYNSWEECRSKVEGFVDAKFMRFKTREMAVDAFAGNYRDFIGKEIVEKILSDDELKRIGKPVLESIAVDAAYDTSTGIMEFRGVDTKTRKEIFRKGPFFSATNNIGEFLALVHALYLLKWKGNPLPVYSDSVTALAWVRNRKAKTELAYSKNNKTLFNMVAQAEVWLKTNDYPNRVLKWETQAWGENPADFGRK